MDNTTVEAFKAAFTAYVHTFDSTDSDIQRNMLLKYQHTERVCQEILRLGQELALSPPELCLAEIMALFHDVGRFEQYRTYRTFSDRDSVNHAELGVQILETESFLAPLDDSTRDLILRVIGYHNRAELPVQETERCLFFTRLLRDADKLDIWRVVIDYYQSENGNRNEAIGLGFPDRPEISPAVCKDLQERRIVDIGHLKTLNDFKLLQIGWIFDINFLPTLRTIQERRYLEDIRATMPASAQLDAIFQGISAYLATAEETLKLREMPLVHDQIYFDTLERFPKRQECQRLL